MISRFYFIIPYLLFSLLITVMGLLTYIVVGFVKKKRLRITKGDKVNKKEPVEENHSSIKKIFNEIESLAAKRSGEKDLLYDIPWIVAINGDTGFFRDGLNEEIFPDRVDFKELERIDHKLLAFHVFSRGLIIDVSPDIRKDEWEEFIVNLIKIRYKRPLDGVIVSVDHDCLTGERKRLEETANKVFTMISKMRKRVDMSFPLYLTVKGLSKIPEFRFFQENLPINLKDDILGWSNPYAIDLSYGEEWMDEAFVFLEKNLKDLRLNIYSSLPLIKNKEEMYLFPNRIIETREPLKLFANIIFQESYFKETCYFRGFYYTDFPFFIKDFLVEKVFKEAGLAKPTQKRIMKKKKNYLFYRLGVSVFIILWGAGLLLSRSGIEKEAANLEKNLAKIGEIIRNTKTFSSKELVERILNSLKNASEHPLFQKLKVSETLEILDAMSDIEVDRLTNIFIPASWFSDVDDRLIEAMAEAYDKIVFRAIFHQLKSELDYSIYLKKYGEGNHTIIDGSPENSPFYLYVSDMRKIELNMDKYNRINETGSVKDLKDIVTTIFNYPLSSGFNTKSGYYKKALLRTDPRKIRLTERERREASKKLFRLFYDFNRGYISPKRIYEQTADLNRSMENLLINGEMKDIVIVKKQLDDLENFISSPWLKGEKDTLDRKLNDVLTIIDASVIYTEQVTRVIRELKDTTYAALKNDLAVLEIRPFGKLFEKNDSTGDFNLSSKIMGFKKTIDILMESEFMASNDSMGNRSAETASGLLSWDLTKLTEVNKIINLRDYYVDSVFIKQPTPIDSVLCDILDSYTIDLLWNVLMESVIWEKEQKGITNASVENGLVRIVNNYEDGVDHFKNIISFLKERKAESELKDVLDFMGRNVIKLLERIDILFEKEELYQINEKNLEKWDGRSNLAEKLFGFYYHAKEKEFFDSQKDKVAFFVEKMVFPLVNMAEKNELNQYSRNTGLVDKWKTIILELEKFKDNKPNNTVLSLESFIVNDLPLINCDNYKEFIDVKEIQRQGNDYFTRKRNEIQLMILAKCENLFENMAMEKYMEAAKYFNQYLGVKFPFSKYYVQNREEAPPEAIEEFYRLFDDGLNNKEDKLLSAIVNRRKKNEVSVFLEKIKKNRLFFSSIQKDLIGNVITKVKFELEFRVNKEKEVNGNQVISWEMELGNQKLRPSNGKIKAEWTYGDPIVLSFRWAKNSPYVPLSSQNEEYANDGTGKIHYTFDNDWSLIRLIKETGLIFNDRTGISFDNDPHTLRFDINTVERKNDNSPKKEIHKAIFFLRIKLYSLKNERIILSSFPSNAPLIK